MIQLKGFPAAPNVMWPPQSTERIIYEKMIQLPKTFWFSSLDELKFTIQLRAQVTRSARLMAQSNVTFEVFKKSYCNSRFWILTNFGGFQLRPQVNPAAAIRDIYENSRQYGFECATAMVIIYYHAVLELIDENTFNRYFNDLHLYSWNADPDLGLSGSYTDTFIPGDVIYFNNPDFFPKDSPWRGENAVVLEDGSYFGHGMGIKSEREIINILNNHRMAGSTQSAYLSNLVTRPDFMHLLSLSNWNLRLERKLKPVIIGHNKPSISYIQYLYYFN